MRSSCPFLTNLNEPLQTVEIELLPCCTRNATCSQNYMQPLRTNNLVDRSLIDEIFYQIPEILDHHEMFLAALQARLDNWDQNIGDNCIGDVFRETVSF